MKVKICISFGQHPVCSHLTGPNQPGLLYLLVVVAFTVTFVYFLLHSLASHQIIEVDIRFCIERLEISFKYFPVLSVWGYLKSFFILEFMFLKLKPMSFLIWCATVHALDSKGVGCSAPGGNYIICVTP
jgi:hypothetical protein